MHCIGVDGCKVGWFAVARGQGGGFAFHVHAEPRALIAACADARVIAVDVPIGLAERGPRAPDRAARAFVGPQRASSIFSAPVRGVIGASTYAEALRLRRQLDDGRGLSAQAFGILPKIRAWDEVLRSDADARARVFEIHPEVSFAALNDDVGLAAGKKTAHGREQRLALLGRVFDETAVRTLLAAVPRRAAAADDVLDAFAALWSAERIANGVARSLPSSPAVDANGWNVAIYY